MADVADSRSKAGDCSAITRREALRALGLGGAGLLLGACAPVAAPGGVPTTAPASGTATRGATASAQARRGGTLRVGAVGDVATLDPHRNTVGRDVVFHMYDRLTAYNQKLEPQPVLAESWERSADARALTLHLRHGVLFHTGRELTSDDVKFNLMRVKDPKVGPLNGNASPLVSVDTPDKYTVVLNSTDAWPWVFDLLEFVCILDPVTLQGPDGVNKPVGTGPFAFGDYAQGDHLRMVRNANYWQSGQPHVDELLVSFAQDPVAMVTQLEAKSLDVAVSPNVQDVVRLQKDNHYQVIEAQNTGRGWIMMANTTVTPLDNKLVRQALNFAVDRQRMLDTVLSGIGQPMQLPWGQSSIGFDAAKNTNIYPFDLDKARSLLANAGVSNFSLDLVFSVTTPAAFAQILQGDLAKIGVTASLKQLEPAAWTQQAINISYQGLLLSNILQTNLGMGTQVTGPFFAPDTNSAGFRDPQYSALAKAVMTETDPAKQKDEAAQFTDYVMDQSFVYPICSSPPTAICTNNVSGVNYNMHDTIWFGQASLSA